MSFTIQTRSTDPAPVAQGSDSWLRPLVADHLGVTERDLAFNVSLGDDLAADSLDFAELASAMEYVLGIEIPVSRLTRVRTYGELLALADSLVQERSRRAREGVADRDGQALERIFWLDPYAIEILLDDARHADAGTRLEVLVDPGTPSSVIARVRARLGRLERRGVVLDVRRDRRAA